MFWFGGLINGGFPTTNPVQSKKFCFGNSWCNSCCDRYKVSKVKQRNLLEIYIGILKEISLNFFQTKIFSTCEVVQPRDWLNDKRCYHNLSTRLDISPKWVNMIIQKQITSYFAHYLSHTVWLVHFIKFIRSEVTTSEQGSADRGFIKVRIDFSD